MLGLGCPLRGLLEESAKDNLSALPPLADVTERSPDPIADPRNLHGARSVLPQGHLALFEGDRPPGQMCVIELVVLCLHRQIAKLGVERSLPHRHHHLIEQMGRARRDATTTSGLA